MADLASAVPAPAIGGRIGPDRTAARAAPGVLGGARRRFRRHRAAMAALGFVALLAVVAVAAPLLAPHNPVRGDAAVAGPYRQAAWIDDADPRRTGSWTYPLGTDGIGRDVLSRLLYAARVSLIVGFVPTLLILLIGVPVGLAAGYAGGRVDDLLMRLTDAVYAFPALLFYIVAQASLRETWLGQMLSGLVLLFVTLSVVGWTGMARLVRGQAMLHGRQDFVVAARASGASGVRIVGRHILPNVLGPIVVAAVFVVPTATIAEATLSYLGIGMRPGVRPDNPFPSSLGQMILDGSTAWQAQPWMLVAPSLALGALTLAFTLIGDGLRDALDPHAR